LKTGHAVGITSEGRWQDLDGDVALQPRVAGAIDLAHSAGAEHGFDFVGT
jgi:hypothetical protein